MEGFVINSALLLFFAVLKWWHFSVIGNLFHFCFAMMCRCAWSNSLVEGWRKISCHYYYYYYYYYYVRAETHEDNVLICWHILNLGWAKNVNIFKWKEIKLDYIKGSTHLSNTLQSCQGITSHIWYILLKVEMFMQYLFSHFLFVFCFVF